MQRIGFASGISRLFRCSGLCFHCCGMVNGIERFGRRVGDIERDRLVHTALSRFGELRGLGAGMHTTLMLDADLASAVARRALERGVEVPTLAESARSHHEPGGLVIGYGRVDAVDLVYALEVISDCLADHGA